MFIVPDLSFCTFWKCDSCFQLQLSWTSCHQRHWHHHHHHHHHNHHHHQHDCHHHDRQHCHHHMFPASFLDDQEKKELLRELRKAFGMEDKVFSVMIVIMLFMMMVIMFLMRLPMKELPMMKGSLENSNFLSSLSSVQFPSLLVTVMVAIPSPITMFVR